MSPVSTTSGRSFLRRGLEILLRICREGSQNSYNWVSGPRERREEVMPTYEFYCTKCKKTVPLLLSLREFEKKKYKCPSCGQKSLKQEITHFQTKTSKKS